MVCRNCSKEVEEGCNFCQYCGEALEVSLVCDNCKNQLEEDSSFCKHCGTATHFSKHTGSSTTDQAPVQNEAKMELADQKGGCGAKVVAVLIVGLIIFGANLTWFTDIFTNFKEPKEHITLNEYRSIETGMSYDRVRVIVGSAGSELARSDIAGYSTFIVAWEGVGSAGANANVTFQNGKVISKAQYGLK